MNIWEAFTTYVHESSLSSTAYGDNIYRQLKGFSASDKELGGQMRYGSDPQRQINRQTESIKDVRDELLQRVDVISDHHIAKSVKNSIVGDCFHALCDKKFVNIQYRTDDKEVHKLFNDQIEKCLKRTYFLEIFKNCLINDGMNYCEIFLGTKCKPGEGITSISDDVNVRRHIAVYKNLTAIGFIKYKYTTNETTPADYIDPEEISHFIVNPEKVPLEISFNINDVQELPEKIMVAEPLLTPIVDLIIQYNALEFVSTGVELCNALAPTILGVGVSGDTDLGEILKQLQQFSIELNSTRNNILNNLANINTDAIAKEIGRIQLIPFTIQDGVNSIKEVNVHKHDNRLTEKLNNILQTIERAMGLPEGYIAFSSFKDRKEGHISMNPQYSRRLSGIQQSLAKGIGDFIYKDLKWKFSTVDSKGRVIQTRDIDRTSIEVKFNSITNIDNRLDMEQVMLTAETMGNIAGILDMIAGSPNLPVKTNGEAFMKLWGNLTEFVPSLRDSLEIDENLEQRNEEGLNYGGMDTYEYSGNDMDNYEITPNTKNKKNIDKEEDNSLTSKIDKKKEKLDKKDPIKGNSEVDIKDIYI